MCPPAGLLFALASDPMLNCFDERLVSGGDALVAACADDIGMAVKSIELLAFAAEVFETIERLTCLGLKPANGTLVPVSVVLPASRRRTQWKLTLVIPEAPLFLQRWRGPTLAIVCTCAACCCSTGPPCNKNTLRNNALSSDSCLLFSAVLPWARHS